MLWCLCLFRIYEIEKAVDTPEKFMFPNFETVHWYAAKNIYDTIQGWYHATNQRCSIFPYSYHKLFLTFIWWY